MHTTKKSVAIALLCFISFTPLAAQEAQIDSLIALGKAHFEVGNQDKAITALNEAVSRVPHRIQTYLTVGDIYLNAGHLNQAMKAYQEALDLNDASPEAQTGIAEVHYRKASGGITSIYHARRAVSTARRATRLNPDYAPAYITLGRAYIRLNENYTAAARAFVAALERQPDNPEIAYLLGDAYIELARNADGAQRNARMVLDAATFKRLERHLETSRFLPIVAQILFDKGVATKALDTFERYIQTLSETEQAYYRDITFLASKQQIETYNQTPEEKRPAFLKQFWAKRDFDLLTEVNERLIEHYRRVWYARTHFSRSQIPWDARGEIYVRYGDPDYRAYSDRQNPDMNPAVTQIKERLALALYGPESLDETFVGPVYPVRSNQSFVGVLDPASIRYVDEGGNLLSEDALLDAASEGTTDEVNESLQATSAFQNFLQSQMRPENAHHYRPVTSQGDMTIVPWETWIYTRISEGIEITFTDELGKGLYGYAPIPDFPEEEGSIGLHRFSQYVYYAPQAIAARTVADIPEYYRPGGPMSGLEFSYDFADFRADSGQTRLEVYYAIAPSEMGTIASGDTSTILADCAIVLTDTAYTHIYREEIPLRYRVIGHRKWPEDAFIPNLLSLDIPSGDYLLTVQLNDAVAERKGIYRHRIRVEPYGPDVLQISDIQLSWNISDRGGDAKFRKGDVWVVPMTTRAYQENQSAYAYYELYNLSRDHFGQTRYRITYTIGSEDPKRPFNLVRSSFSALTKLFQREQKTQVRVSFDQTATETSPIGYFELSLKKVRPGYNRLTVTVEDLNNDQTATKEILFRYKR